MGARAHQHSRWWARPLACARVLSPPYAPNNYEPRMFPPQSERSKELCRRVAEFMEAHVYPAEGIYKRQVDEAKDRWDVPSVMNELKAKAKAAGLWNMFLPRKHYPEALTNLEYAPVCEIMGRSPIGPESFNCSAPDTGNMET